MGVRQITVVMDQFSRQIIELAVHSGDCDGIAYCRMFNEITAGNLLPNHLSSDNDPLFLYHRWKVNLRVLEIEEIKTVPHVSLSHPFVERLIGTVQREYLGRTLFWNTSDLKRKLTDFQHFYNQNRVHTSLDGQTPLAQVDDTVVSRADLVNYKWNSYCRGLFQLPNPV